MGLKARPCKVCDDGMVAPDEITSECPECGWHECSTPAVWLHDHRTCPECGHEW